MPRGGKRQGSPGKGYSNRTDLQMNYDNENVSAASGGMAEPTPTPMAPSSYPEDTPMLMDPTQRPDEPVTAGLVSGLGAGSEAMDPRLDETRKLKRWLPIIEPMLDDDDTPMSVRALVRYIKGT
jgi:hypothetical protein